MNTEKRLEDYSWDELLEATSAKESYKEAGRSSAAYTLETNTGIHTNDKELRKKWSSMGGKAGIEKLLKWQQETGFRVCDLERTDEWVNNIKKGVKKYYDENPITDEMKKRISDTIKENNLKLSNEERSIKFSNDCGNVKSLRIRTEILNMIPTDEFTTLDAKIACEKYGLGNWKGFLKDTRLITQLRKGINKEIPGLYKKV